jgi:glycosyltransferase involved in cell wall biosynthesis
MRIAVDARTVYSPARRGTGKNLVDLYRRVARLRPDWTFLMFHRMPVVEDDPFRAEPNIIQRAIEIRGDRWDLWEQVRLPLAAARARASVLHAPANTAPRNPLVPLVVTIHDLIPVDMGMSDIVRAWSLKVGRAARNARRIITPSQFTKDRIVNHFRIPADKIVVNHWAPDSGCRRVDEPTVIEQARTRMGLAPGQPYIFGFGAEDPRKNTMRIIEAWAGLDAALRSRLGLLLIGLQEPALTDARERARTLAPDGNWSLMPFVDEEQLSALMSGATAVCYPSLSEGFGLPVLDAFVCGAPVITSNSSSLPEVAGDAALLVDPTDVSAIRSAMERLAVDDDLRTSLRARGYERVRQFTWDRCAQRAADVLGNAA